MSLEFIDIICHWYANQYAMSAINKNKLQIQELPELPTDMDAFLSASDLSFATIRARGGRSYHINPYYVAAWSTVFSERLCGATNGSAMLDSGDPISCPMLSYDELRYFLMAIHPPQLRITGSSFLLLFLIGWVGLNFKIALKIYFHFPKLKPGNSTKIDYAFLSGLIGRSEHYSHM